MAAALEPYINHTVSIITADGRNIIPDDLVSLYKEYARTPQPSLANIDAKDSGVLSLRVQWGSRDLDFLEKDSYAKYFSVSHDGEIKVTPVSDLVDVSKELGFTLSNAGDKRVVLRSKEKEGKEKQYLDIWGQREKIKSIDVEALGGHGNIITKFGKILWSPDDRALLYVAEYKKPKAESFFKPKSKENGKNPSDTQPGEEYTLSEDWGETFDGIVHTVVCVLNLKTLDVSVVDVAGVSASDAFWINSERIGFVGWNENPRRLGLVYCSNRISRIYECALDAVDKGATVLRGDGTQCIRSPRVSPDGKKMVFLENSVFGPHHKASQMWLMDFSSSKSEVIVDITTGNPNVKSIFLWDTLPARCWSKDSRNVLLSTPSFSKSVIVAVNVETKTVKEVAFPYDSATLLDLNENYLVAVGSSVATKPQVLISKFADSSLDGLKWTHVEPVQKSDTVEGVTFRVDAIPSEVDGSPVYGILIGPSAAEKSASPVFVIPHGGPHSNNSLCYMTYCVLFAKLGFKSLLINYRGSSGVDDDFIDALPGHVGHLDVKDVISAINFYASQNVIDKSKMVLFGGSHGGFLVTHLSGQYPELNWAACITRNPVTDMAGMTEATDIPDWCWVETFGKDISYTVDKLVCADTLRTMFEKSPMAHVAKVKVPTLMLLGKKDRRVPYTQGLKWYHALKALGVETKCHVYDDNHSLQKVEVDSDVFVNTTLWALKHLN